MQYCFWQALIADSVICELKLSSMSTFLPSDSFKQGNIKEKNQSSQFVSSNQPLFERLAWEPEGPPVTQ